MLDSLERVGDVVKLRVREARKGKFYSRDALVVLRQVGRSGCLPGTFNGAATSAYERI